MITDFLFVKIIFLSVPWYQETLEKTYGLRCLNEVMVSDSFAFRKTKICQEHALSAEVDAGDLIAFVSDWSRTNCK